MEEHHKDGKPGGSPGPLADELRSVLCRAMNLNQKANESACPEASALRTPDSWAGIKPALCELQGQGFTNCWGEGVDKHKTRPLARVQTCLSLQLH